MNPSALAKAKAKLDAVGKAAIGDMHALRAELSAAQATAAGAAYGQIASGLELRRHLHQRNQVGSELASGPVEGLVEPARPRVSSEINWALLRGILTALIVAFLLAPSVAMAATEAQLRTALVQAHRDVTGKAPSANRLAVAMAQVGLEVGRGKAVTCNNIGQLAAPRKDPHCYTKGGFRVRRYRSLRASAAAYWRLKAVRRALPFFDRRDVRGAALALKRGGYYTADFEVYASRMAAVYREQNR